MSLVSYASIWTNDDDPNNNATKKRVASLRKTMKKNPVFIKNIGEPDEYSNNEKKEEDYQEDMTISTENKSDDRGEKLNQIVNKLTNLSRDNDGNGLANFTPLPNPIINKKTDIEDDKNVNGRKADVPLSYQNNPMQIPPPVLRRNSESTNFISNLPDLGNFYSSYHKSYDAPRQPTGSYNPGPSISPLHNDKVMEKINYMIHLLEEQHNEKTSNITEEFILYTFLGVFIIFIVDSFARAGKYTR
jgi:hypothetical protein